MPREYYELRAEDVGKSTIRAFGKPWMVEGFMGRILKRDIGKRVYNVEGILQVENDEQLTKRLQKRK